MAFIIDTEHGILKKYFPQPEETEIIIPENIKIIAPYAFSGCENLYSVRIPEGVESIEKRAFQKCKNLLFVSLPQSLKKSVWKHLEAVFP